MDRLLHHLALHLCILRAQLAGLRVSAHVGHSNPSIGCYTCLSQVANYFRSIHAHVARCDYAAPHPLLALL